jgi:hypothetical protein
MQKGIFIGLGGSGVTAVAHLKYKLLSRLTEEEQRDFPTTCKFIFVDTDSSTRGAINQYYRDILASELIRDDEYIDFGMTNPHQTYWAVKRETQRDNDKERLLQWMDPRAVNSLRDQPLQFGAGGYRIEGRTALWLNHSILRQRINAALGVLQDIRNQEDFLASRPPIWVFTGSCGGTGSSAILDVLYLIDREFRVQYPNFGEPFLRLVVFLPFGYIQENREFAQEKYSPNAYAFIAELQSFLKDRWITNDGGRKFKNFSVRVDTTNRDDQWPLFYYALLVDTKTESNYEIPLKDGSLYKNTAELVFYLHTGSVTGQMLANLDNWVHQYCDKSKDWVKSFIAAGYRALRGAEEYLKKYLSARFLYELFHYGLRGKEFNSEIIDTTQQYKLVEEFVDTVLRRFLFQEQAREDLPNLQRDYGRIFATFSEAVNDNAFKNEKGKYESGLIRSQEHLDRFNESAKSTIENMSSMMEETFRTGRNGPASTDLQEAIRKQTEAEIERNIVAYGLQYTRELVRRFDLSAENLYLDLQKQLVDSSSKRARLDEQRRLLVGQCVQDKGKSFPEFYRCNREYFEEAYREKLVTLQIEILRWLSRGEEGWIDSVERQLDALIAETGNRIQRLKKEYSENLTKQFMETREDVTTTFLPPIHKFVNHQGWVQGNEFAQVYESVVPHDREAATGKWVPVRHAPHIRKDKHGLQLFLWEILTRSDVTGIQPMGYYDSDGESVSYFRKVLDRSTTPAKALEQLENFAQRYIELEFYQKEVIRREITKSLSERFNELQASEQEAVVKQYTAGTEVFCPLNFAGEPRSEMKEVIFYAGPERNFAARLGFNETEHQFVEDNHSKALYRIKMYVGVHLGLYAHTNDLKLAYDQLKNNKPDKFYPHIHRIFNKEPDLDKAVALLQTISSPDEAIARLLLYRKLFLAAEDTALAGGVFDLGGIGNFKGVSSPLMIEQKGSRFHFSLAREVSVNNNKIKIERGKMDTIPCDGTIHSFVANIRTSDKLYVLADFEAALESLRGLNAYSDPRWSKLIENATKALKEEIEKLHAESNRPEYETIHNSIDAAASKIRSVMNI